MRIRSPILNVHCKECFNDIVQNKDYKMTEFNFIIVRIVKFSINS